MGFARFRASDDLQEPIWRKPKGTHEEAFDRYANEDEAIIDEINASIKAKFQLCGARTPRIFDYKRIIDRAGVTTKHG